MRYTKISDKDYTALTLAAAKVGLVPYSKLESGAAPFLFSIPFKQAPIDLSASALDEISILQNAVQQLSERLNDIYDDASTVDLND